MSSTNTIGHMAGPNYDIPKNLKTLISDFYFNTSDINKDNIKIIGHRGNQGVAIENSYSAIIDCSNNVNIDGTEFDIRPTKDNKIVVMHNENVNGTTSSKGRIQDLTLEELKKLRFKTQTVDQFLQKLFNIFNRDKYFYEQYCRLGKQNSKIVLFSKIMESYSPNKHMLIELKGQIAEYSNSKQRYFEDNIVDILKQYDYQNRDLALESYNLDALFRIKEKLPDLKIIALINKNGNLKPLDMPFDGVSLEYNLLNMTSVEKVMKNNMVLYSWDDKRPIAHYNTINEMVFRYGNEIESGELPLYVINDFPEKARQYIKK